MNSHLQPHYNNPLTDISLLDNTNISFITALEACPPNDRVPFLLINSVSIDSEKELLKILGYLTGSQALNYCMLISTTLRNLTPNPESLLRIIKIFTEDNRPFFLAIIGTAHTATLEWTAVDSNELLSALPASVRLVTAKLYLNLKRFCNAFNMVTITESLNANEIEDLCLALDTFLETSVVTNFSTFLRVADLFPAGRLYRLFELIGENALTLIFQSASQLTTFFHLMENDEQRLTACEAFEKNHLAKLFHFSNIPEFLAHAQNFTELYRYRFSRLINFDPITHVHYIEDLSELFDGLGPFTANLMVKNFDQNHMKVFFEHDDYETLLIKISIFSGQVINLHALLSYKFSVEYFTSMLRSSDLLCDWVSFLKNAERLGFCQRFEPKFFTRRIRKDDSLQNMLLLFARRDRIHFIKFLPLVFWHEIIDSPEPLGRTIYTLLMKEGLDFPNPEEKPGIFKLTFLHKTLRNFCHFLTIGHIENVLHTYERLKDLLNYLPPGMSIFFVMLLSKEYQQRIIINSGNAQNFMKSLSKEDKREWQMYMRRNSVPSTVQFFQSSHSERALVHTPASSSRVLTQVGISKN